MEWEISERGKGKEEGAEIGWREGFINQWKKPLCQREEESPQKKVRNCINVVDTWKGRGP